MPKSLKLILLSIRDLVASIGPVLFIAIGLLVAAYIYLDPQPPRRLTMATGPAGSAYATFGQRYAEALRSNGITVDLLPTEGSTDNLRLLRSGQADVGFVRGGAGDPIADQEAGLTSLGALFYEPLWVFYRAVSVTASVATPAPATRSRTAPLPPTPALDALPQLRGLRIATDRPGSGVPDIVRQLLEANRLSPSGMRLTTLDPAPAVAALLAGTVDAVVLASAPEAPSVQQLLRAPGIRLLDFGQSDAYVRRFAFLQAVSLPRGVVELAADLPPQDVSLLAATTSLIAREQTHPALRQLLAQAAQKLHGDAGWFNRARDFPNTRTSELPVSPEGDRAINGTPPFWQRYLPFWASNLVERMWLVLGGLLVLMLPLSKIVPPLYAFRVRSRVFRWYARLRDIEARVDACVGPSHAAESASPTGTAAAENHAERDGLLDELDELDRVANQVTVPLSYANELYALRTHIDTVRRRLLRMDADGIATHAPTHHAVVA